MAASLNMGALRLLVLLDLLASVRAARRASYRGDGFTLAAADLVAEQAAGDAADRHAGNLVGVLGGVLHGHILADGAGLGRRVGAGRLGQKGGAAGRGQHRDTEETG